MSVEHIVLDLDNTLISAHHPETFPFHDEAIENKAIKFRMHDMDSCYIVFERPGLQKFLDWLFTTFRVSVWTAASKNYALFVVDKIVLAGKPARKLEHILFSYHCGLSREKYNGDSKNLRLMSEFFDLTDDSLLIIDDLDEVALSQPSKSIHIPAFEFMEEGSAEDTTLADIRKQLLAMKA